jgi:hypothetical protein
MSKGLSAMMTNSASAGFPYIIGVPPELRYFSGRLSATTMWIDQRRKRKARVKCDDRNGRSVTIRIWEDEYQVLRRYAEDIAKIRGMPKRLPIGETIAYLVRYFDAAYKERWEDVCRIAKDEQECVVDYRRFLDRDRKRRSRAKMSNKSG